MGPDGAAYQPEARPAPLVLPAADALLAVTQDRSDFKVAFRRPARILAPVPPPAPRPTPLTWDDSG